MDLLYDTNILIEAVKLSQNDEKVFWKKVNPQRKKEFISVVTYAEIKVITICNAWGNNRIEKLNTLFEEIQIIPISPKIIEAYVEIDVCSRGKHSEIAIMKDNQKMSAIEMGKNDLWIAATAHSLSCQLVTTDDDFDHLKNIFIAVNKIDRDKNGAIIL
ncbi:MAG: type II toxin-antitoxin system VapC family toxin [Bacteroidetes bacterium]|nr:MAG: type II toxin-antitoxin system VapC family toxin [Bacteroidota bacterium]